MQKGFNKPFLARCAIAATALFLISAPAYAIDGTESEAELLKMMPPLEDPLQFQRVFVQDLMKDLGIESGSALHERLVKKISTYDPNKAEAIRLPKPEEVKIAKHLRGTAGQPLSARDLKQFPYPSITMEEFNAQTKDLKVDPEIAAERDREALMQWTTLDLPVCASSGSRTIEQTSPGVGSLRGNVFDILYLQSANAFEKIKLRDTDPSELFGAATIVYDYQPGVADVVGSQALLYGATCLPFRIRATDQTVYFSHGDEALKNFDGDPEGSGGMHEIVAKHLREFYR